MTPPIENPSKDEIGQVGSAVNGLREGIIGILEAYNETTARLRDTVGRVARTAETVSGSSRTMAATSEESGRAAGEIAHAIGDIAQGAERQVQMVDQTKRSVRKWRER